MQIRPRILSRLSATLLAASLLNACAGSGVSVGDVAGALGAASASGDAAGLSSEDIVSGLKEALTKGSTAVVSQLGQPNGFSDDPIAHIPLPESLDKAASFARKVGLGSQFDALEARLNEAAEEATPKAQALFVNAVRNMSFDDARGILAGEDDAATQFFREETGDNLSAEMQPIVDSALAQVGAVSTFNSIADRISKVPLAPSFDADLTGYVTEKAKDGIFHYLAEEEKAIRENPLERTSAILQRVFGS